MSVRRLAERLSRGRAYWRRLPDAFSRAPLLVSPDAALQLLKVGPAAFDPMLLRFAREEVRPGMAVWDVGANLGILSVAAAALGADVLAVEPDPFLSGLLRRTAAHPDHRARSIDVLGVAVADAPGTARLSIAARGRASNYLEAYGGRSMSGGTRASCLVPVLTLDLIQAGRSPPDVVKIDVEGAELAVLDGAADMLRAARPTVLVEVNAETGKAILDRFADIGDYRVFDYESGAECSAGAPLGMNLIARPSKQ